MTPTDTEAAFVAAMATDPGDDTARLAFADWLDERGAPADQARAELIRLQCGPDRGTEATDARVKELNHTHRTAWDAPLAPFGATTLHYYRGFPHTMRADFARIVEHQELLGLAPHWHLHPMRGESVNLIELCPRFTAGPFADRVRELSLRRCGWWAQATEALLNPTVVDRLSDICLDDGNVPVALNALLRAPNAKLRSLGCDGEIFGGLGDAGCRLVAENVWFSHLTSLRLTNNVLSAAAPAALAGSPHLAHLRCLELTRWTGSDGGVGDDGARRIADSATFRHLTELDLSGNGITDAGVLALLSSPHLAALKNLTLDRSGITDVSLTALSESGGLPALQRLSFWGKRGGQITAAGLTRLAHSPRMGTLTGLIFADHPIGDEGARALAESPNCRNLRWLCLDDCGISAEAFSRLLESPQLASVRRFAISGDPLTQDDIAAFRARYGSRIVV